jgi:redox-sensitive bicupin YhaK (pirin superfamily)
MPEPQLRRAADRYETVGDGVRTRHSFSYGDHYDPANVGLGPLVAVNTEHVEPGRGYEPHRHSDVEIVTWVLRGVLRHEDTAGPGGLVEPGTAQRLSAGEGVRHGEHNASATEPLVFVQMMLASQHGDAPEYAQVRVPDGPGLHETVPVHAPARLLVARPEPGADLAVPAATRTLVHVTRGRVRVEEQVLEPGDELRVHDGRALVLAAAEGGEPAEALVWLLGA